MRKYLSPMSAEMSEEKKIKLMKLVGEGLSAQQIGERLGISKETARRWKKRIEEKG